ncbi:MAG: DUF952 domain-containing protein [Pseudomonadota bacterium]
MDETRVYKILSAEDWETAQALGYTKTALDEADGYVHLSTRAQVSETLRLHYAGQSDVHLLEYVLEHFSCEVRWEESRGGQLFPHLYGTLRIDAAKRIWALVTVADITPILPQDIDE